MRAHESQKTTTDANDDDHAHDAYDADGICALMMVVVVVKET